MQDEFIERIASMLPPGSKSQNARTDWENLGILPFALAGIWGSGRALFLADHSIFINNMMLQEDLGNVGFTCNCLDWLRDGEERRDRVLLYDEGEVVTDFNVPAMIPPPRLPDDPITLVNQVITGLEDENMHNRLLLEHLGFERITRWTIVALTTLLAVYLFWRLVRSRYRQEAAAPLLAPTLSRFAPVGVGLSQRHKALLAEGNLWEPARALARDFFENAIGRPEPPATLPPFQASMGWPARRFVEKLVQHLWRVAYGAKPERIAPAAFAHLAAQLDELRAAVADGSLRFQTIRTA